MSTYRTLKVPASEITPHSIWLRRRELLATGAGAIFSLLAPSLASAMPLKAAKSMYTVADKLTPKKDVTSYNNFYEFGVGKSDPSEYSGDFKPLPWAIKVDGMVGKPRTFDFDQIMKAFPPEERVYRMRCVEAWSMVIPWDGFPLGDLLKKAEPTSRAKYVAFESAVQPSMPGVHGYAGIPFPYLEGLRIDEAMHPLALLATG